MITDRFVFLRKIKKEITDLVRIFVIISEISILKITYTMKFRAEIDVMPLKEILDPQGKAVKLGLDNLGVTQVHDVRIGKHIQLEVEAENKAEAEQKVELACKKLLANLIMEYYEYEIFEVEMA